MDKEEIEIETNAEDLERQDEEPEGAHEAGGEVDPGAGADLNPESEVEGDEVEVSIGDPIPQAWERQDTQLVRDLRRVIKDKSRRIKELEANQSAPTAETKPAQLGPKPKIEDFDFDYEKYDAALDRWHEDKHRADQESQRKRDEIKAQEDAWQAELGNHATNAAELKTKLKNYEELEEEAASVLNPTQRGLIIHLFPKTSAQLMAALGGDPAQAKKLSETTDNTAFIRDLTRLEAQLKVTPRKSKPEPERVLSGSTRSLSATVDSTLERLREEAARTGDMSKVMAYKRQKQNPKP